MTLGELRKKVQEWDQVNPDGSPIAQAKYTSILTQIEYHAKNEWKVYLPAENPGFSSNYMERLAAWIGNVSTEDEQKLFLEYALQISFFSHDDFLALYRTALYREVFPWIARIGNVKLDGQSPSDFCNMVSDLVSHRTWYCPITDSMDINKFCKVNHLTGIGHHPGFATLQMQAEHPTNPNSQIADDWIRYMDCPNNDPVHPHPSLSYLVLLEDVVGSGSQCLSSVRWAVKNFNVPILFIPLILCPNGSSLLQNEEINSSGKLSVRPIIELSRSDLLGPERQNVPAWRISSNLEDLATRYKSRLSVGMNEFGYESTGCSVATFSNAPDNTLPIVHYSCPKKTWNPLFPRVFRD